jgi:glycerophosphoryl diester phosphodiesterase
MGHRGAKAEAPENTLMSFERALHVGTDIIELDVRETADGHLVCFHDPDVSGTTDGTGLVSELTLDEVRSLDAGQAQKVPLLEEVLDFARGRIGVNIDVKVHGAEERILQLVEERKMVGTTMVSAFHHVMLEIVRELSSKITTALLFTDSIEDYVSHAVEIEANAINPKFEILTPEAVRSAHEVGLAVYPWTVNDELSLLRMLEMNVNGVITDNPRLAIQVITEFMESKQKGI